MLSETLHAQEVLNQLHYSDLVDVAFSHTGDTLVLEFTCGGFAGGEDKTIRLEMTGVYFVKVVRNTNESPLVFEARALETMDREGANALLRREQSDIALKEQDGDTFVLVRLSGGIEMLSLAAHARFIFRDEKHVTLP